MCIYNMKGEPRLLGREGKQHGRLWLESVVKVQDIHTPVKNVSTGVAVHAFNPSTREAEGDRSQSLKPAWVQSGF